MSDDLSIAWRDPHHPPREEISGVQRLADLVAEILAIADRAAEKDQIPAAKLQIETRQWVVEKILLKETPGRREAGEPISVTIHTGAERE